MNQSTPPQLMPTNILGAEGAPAVRTAVRLGTPGTPQSPREVTRLGTPQDLPALGTSPTLLLEVELARIAHELPDIEVVDIDYHGRAPTDGEADAATEGQADVTAEGVTQEFEEANSDSTDSKWSMRWF